MAEKQPLHIKHRPDTWEKLVGNGTTIAALKSALEREDARPKAILLTGPSGCGKTTIARIIGSVVECSPLDLKEYNAAQSRGIDTVRDIQVEMMYPPLRGKKKVFLMDEAAKLTNDAQSALLKMLEEPPDHVMFILCTTDPEKLLKTIKTRCHTYTVEALSQNDLYALLCYVCEDENADWMPEAALREIARVSDGSARQALVTLDQVIDIQDDRTLMRAIEARSISEAAAIDICRALSKRDWPTLSLLLPGIQKEKVEDTRYAVLGYFRSILLNPKSTGSHEFAASVIRIFSPSLMYVGAAGLAQMSYDATRIGMGEGRR